MGSFIKTSIRKNVNNKGDFNHKNKRINKKMDNIIKSKERNIDIYNSQIYWFNLEIKNEAMDKVTKIVWNNIKSDFENIQQKTRTRLQEYLKVLLCNLFVADRQGKCIAVSRSRSVYTSGKYKRFNIKPKVFFDLQKTMEKYNWLISYTGQKKGINSNKENLKTRIWASCTLLKLMKKLSENNLLLSGKLVELGRKTRNGKINVDFKENKIAYDYENKLMKINELYRKTKFEITEDINYEYYLNLYFKTNEIKYVIHEINDVSCKFDVNKILSKIADVKKEYKYKFQVSNYKLSNEEISYLIYSNSNIINSILLRGQNHGNRSFLPCLKAIFSDGKKRLTHGGRLYNQSLFGLNYQGISSKFRKSITIDGQPTIEADFSSMHISILYAMKKIPLKSDPYNFIGEEYRPLLKLLFLTAINAKDNENCIESLKKRHGKLLAKPFLKEKDILLLHSIETLQPDWYGLLTELKSAHPQIAEFFNSSYGLRLQNKDSKIILDSLNELFNNNICGLPIHDSIIVPVQFETKLKEIMETQYMKHMEGFPCNVEVK